MTKEDERPGARLGEMDANAVRLDRPVCDLRHSGAPPFRSTCWLRGRVTRKRDVRKGARLIGCATGLRRP